MGRALRTLEVGSLIVRGRSERPVYLLMEGGRLELRDAADLWGLDTAETMQRLVSRHDPDSAPGHTGLALTVIGPAGENHAALACILTTGGHAAGRTGMGAVMGAKRLKAIVIAPPRAAQRRVAGRGRGGAPAPGARAAARQYTALLSGPRLRARQGVRHQRFGALVGRPRYAPHAQLHVGDVCRRRGHRRHRHRTVRRAHRRLPRLRHPLQGRRARVIRALCRPGRPAPRLRTACRLGCQGGSGRSAGGALSSRPL